jgi:hypothetical protein
MIYLDHNATTPILPEVLEAMMPYLTSEWGNPSSSYKFGSKLKAAIETARSQVAELIGAHMPHLLRDREQQRGNSRRSESRSNQAPHRRLSIPQW